MKLLECVSRSSNVLTLLIRLVFKSHALSRVSVDLTTKIGNKQHNAISFNLHIVQTIENYSTNSTYKQLNVYCKFYYKYQ